MIPRTFPSTFASNGQQQMVVYFLTSVAGLQRWTDYIPVKLTQGGSENTYNNNGYIDVTVVGRSATDIPFKDYVPVFVDAAATDAWQVNSTGFIPYNYAGFGDASLVLDFTSNDVLDPRITFTRSTTATYFNSAGVLTTTGFNLLTYSEQFDDAAWLKTRATITANTIVAPDGALTADKLVEDTTATASHLIAATITSTTVVNTLSIFAKAAERFRVQLRFAGGSDSRGAAFNLLTGTIEAETLGSTAQANNPRITNVGNGWYRCSIDSAGTGDTAVQIYLDNGTTHSYTGDGYSGIYIWGAQLEAGASATTYIRTEASASGAPRFDYNPTTLAPLGLLIEEQRTNLLTYSEQFDNAAWTKTQTSITANAIVAPDGSLTGDKLVEDTATSSHSVTRSQGVTIGASYAFTVYAKAAERSFFRLQSFNATGDAENAVFNLATGTIVSQSGTSASTITPVGYGWYRCSVIVINDTDTSSAISINLFSDGTTSSYTGNGYSGIYIWGAQFEAGAFATSYIPTVASQVTRAADAASMTGTNFSSWYNAGEGTLYADWSAAPPVVSTFRTLASISATVVGSNDIILSVSNNAVSYLVVSGGALQVSLNPVATLSQTGGKAAGAYKVNDFATVANNGTVLTDTLGILPVNSTQLLIGAYGTNPAILCGTVRKIAYYPRRLSNAELQRITA